MIDLIVLGAAAGGGFPQWNSNAEGCRRARAGDPAAPPRSQASIAISGDGHNWFVVNASPDLRAQITATPALHPREGLRSTPLQGVILTGGEVDTIAGLLTLREREPFTVFADPRVLAMLDANPIFEALNREIVARVAMPHDTGFPLPLKDGRLSGLIVTSFSVPGKVPLYAESVADPAALIDNGETVGLDITDGSRRIVFIPGCAALNDAVRARVEGADAVLFDGTLWRDDEMIAAGLGPKTGRRMGHLSVSGEDGVMALLAPHAIGRRIFIHINNSNPILLADSAERAAVGEAGWEVAFDGMRVTL
ncbi:pyrroloquinoline quinone biosynthesis protein PqqB [Ameyamaea chiangmaiensis]|uniref:Coenzyme PQQ synthesis protein B n=1 Tax=Ameyamaea chiangmaiensis TaxID=442969 RepID=A0A850PF76_9PROT|nr:pyrroloquinoline quinone biosynthesis protein PqqB [Ameyamaea chiangmaiensis]MBS4075953.1 pyrroloquinoline quinone biosynthesis protein PqqB [Ameyamaea chiangmaiensis]NVN39761.1 pyrroloquinoline quinone biosynthesis protein PqqB [Ameyamaea chiangmaiensis]